MQKLNPLFAIDFYKTGHVAQYPKGTEYVYSNFTPRSSEYALKDPTVFDDKVLFVGLQGLLKWFFIDLFNEEFFNKPKKAVLEEYQAMMDTGLGVGSVNCDHIAALHDLGYLPLHIKALPEGSLVNIKVPVLTVINTDANFYWLPNYLEDIISNGLWKGITNATTALQYRRMLEAYAEQTGVDKSFVLFQGHDFSFRGMGGAYDGASSAIGHLTCFQGSDTVAGIKYVQDYYNSPNMFIAGSIPATEHSVMCMGGEASEHDTIKRLITEIYPTGLVSIVSDSWDYWNTLTNISKQLKPEIMSRGTNALGQAKVVFRPDSGDPVAIIAGYKVSTVVFEDLDHFTDYALDIVEIESDKYEAFLIGDKYYKVDCIMHDSVLVTELTENEVKGSVQCLWEVFGGTTNAAGFKELDSHVGLIYGDSITLERAKLILDGLKNKGFASSNIILGIGSYTYQYNTRDSYGFAMKATWGVVNGEAREIFKNPKTGGFKKSAKGLLKVIKSEKGFELLDCQTREQEATGELRSVFLNGKLLVNEPFQTIRDRVKV